MDTDLIRKLKNLTVLVVDDNKNYLDNISEGLEILFKEVHRASTYKEAILQINNKPNIALIDIELDEADGLVLAKEFVNKSKNTLIIFISSYSKKEYLFKAIKLRVIDYIVKPVNFDILMESLKRAVDIFYLDNNEYFMIDNILDLKYEFKTERLFKNKNELRLGLKERKLLLLLIKNQNKITKKREIENYVWVNSYMTDSALKNLILQLRKKIGKERILNVSGAGWLLKVR